MRIRAVSRLYASFTKHGAERFTRKRAWPGVEHCMDMARGILEERPEQEPADAGEGSVTEQPLDIGSDERRMHVRAYNHWVSLLHGRAYPSIEDLNPGSIADFSPHSVLLDFSKGVENPAIRFLGRALREECGVDASITHVA